MPVMAALGGCTTIYDLTSAVFCQLCRVLRPALIDTEGVTRDVSQSAGTAEGSTTGGWLEHGDQMPPESGSAEGTHPGLHIYLPTESSHGGVRECSVLFIFLQGQ